MPYDITQSNNCILNIEPKEYMKRKIFIDKKSVMSKKNLENMFNEVKKG